MATNAFFISETYLKDNSPMNKAIDMTEVYPFAKTAEEVYIQECLGTNLYDDLIAKIIASKASPPTAMNQVDIDLCKKIRNYLVWAINYDALPFIWIKIRNIGPVKQNGDNLETVQMNEMTYLRSQIKDKMTFHMEVLQRFLLHNRNVYTAYYTGWNWSKLYPNDNVSNTMGIVLDQPYDELNYIAKRWFR